VVSSLTEPVCSFLYMRAWVSESMPLAVANLDPNKDADDRQVSRPASAVRTGLVGQLVLTVSERGLSF
jgi:hypothetical protein